MSTSTVQIILSIKEGSTASNGIIFFFRLMFSHLALQCGRF